MLKELSTRKVFPHITVIRVSEDRRARTEALLYCSSSSVYVLWSLGAADKKIRATGPTQNPNTTEQSRLEQ
jgi:hypothetical protein